MTEPIYAKNLMPTSKKELEILQLRAEKYAQKIDPVKKPQENNTYLQFKLNHNSLYGIVQHKIDEVIYIRQLLKLAWLPPFISGVISWKGQILTVLDSNYLCSKKNSQITSLSRIIVITHQKKSLGLLVNELCNFYSFQDHQLNKQLESPIVFNKNYFLGLLDSSITLLNVEAIFNDSALKIEY